MQEMLMSLADVVPFLPVILVVGALVLTFSSSRAEVQHQRGATAELIRQTKVQSTDGSLLIDGAIAEVAYGTEDIKYGFFSLQHYSRRFLLKQGDHQCLVIVTKGQPKPFIKLLDPQRADLVSASSEWKRPGVA
ncbi:hypothetical protein [Rubrivivax sp. JA1026]|uniref:hypothetical protein n=1 Tax=Rubrivivax sp. JA1026 TaxID=2710888 RepID=UPI0013E9627F|nr:hypothetical protein [Rubrivivax sp. JA1026]